MSYKELDKISIDIFKPNINFIFKFNIRLSTENKNNNRQYYHQEFSYNVNKYVEQKVSRTIKISPISYFTLEELYKPYKERINITINSLYFREFKNGLFSVSKWFTSDNFKDLYQYIDDVLSLNIKYKNLNCQINIGENTLLFKPIVIELNNILYEGIIMYINSANTMTHITVDRLLAWEDIISNLNTINLTMSTLSYIGKPDFNMFHTKLSSNSDGSYYEEQVSETTSSPGINNSINKNKRNPFKFIE